MQLGYSWQRLNFRDHFSDVAAGYATFRPEYPEALFEWLSSVTPRHALAWDCACGSGQASRPLASHFELVVGTDASPNQLAAASGSERTRFAVALADRTPLAKHSVDLVTVAQALHWFVGDRFFSEVRRVVRPGGVFAAWTYGMPQIASEVVEKRVHDFIDGPLGPFWPEEIRMVLDGYASISLPFEELDAPRFEMAVEWSLDRFLGFVRTWSAVGRLVDDRGEDELNPFLAELRELWPGEDGLLSVSYRLDLRAGRT